MKAENFLSCWETINTSRRTSLHWIKKFVRYENVLNYLQFLLYFTDDFIYFNQNSCRLKIFYLWKAEAHQGTQIWPLFTYPSLIRPVPSSKAFFVSLIHVVSNFLQVVKVCFFMLHSSDMLNPDSYVYFKSLSNMDSVIIMYWNASISFITNKFRGIHWVLYVINYLPGIIPQAQDTKIRPILWQFTQIHTLET
jgi:hypothetical protein